MAKFAFLIIGCVMAIVTAAVPETDTYRSRTNNTFNPDYQKSLFRVVAPASPDIKVSYYLPDYHNVPIGTSKNMCYSPSLDIPLSESLDVVVNVKNDGIAAKTVKAILAYFTSASDPTKYIQTVTFNPLIFSIVPSQIF